MKSNHKSHPLGRSLFALLCGSMLLTGISIEEVLAKTVIVKPNINVTPKGKAPIKNFSSSEDTDNNGSSNDNPHPAIYCNGHDALITGASAANAFDVTQTKIYIDTNDNGIFEDSECQLLNLSLVYVYGGSLVNSFNYTSYSREQTITMEGGEVAAIYAGGYTNVRSYYSHNVNINVTGGKIGYVSANWDRGPGASSLSWSDDAMSGTVTIMLTSNSESPYMTYHTASDPYTDGARQHVRLFDFSTHSFSLTGNPYYNGKLNYKAYIVQTATGEYHMGGTEEVVIPKECILHAKKIIVDDGATIRNLGSVSLSTCANGAFQNNGTWTGNPVKMPHVVSSDVIGHDASTHSQRCTLCGQEVAAAHIWKYIESASTATSHTHIRVCQICDYSEDGQACTLVCTSVGDEGHSSACSLCNHQFEVQQHAAKTGFWANLHQNGAPSSNTGDYNDTYDYGSIGEGTHRAVCQDCGALYSEQHDWVKKQDSTDAGHTLYCNKCYMPKSGAHNYVDGVCTECGHAHGSHSYENSICITCGIGCTHAHFEYVSDGADQHLKRCTACGSNIGQGSHDFVADNLGRVTCSLCDYSCQHEHTTTLNDQTVCEGCHLPMVAKVNIVSQDYYFADVKTAALYALSTKASHTITLVEDIDLKETLELTLPEATNKLTLDMNGHDISIRQLNMNRLYNTIDVHGKGTLDIINTQFANDGNYAHITTNSLSGTSLKAFNDTHVTIEGCYLTAMQLGRNEGIATGFIALDNCQVEKVETYDGSNYNIYGRVEVLNSLLGKNSDLSQMLPQGIIITEQQADRSWMMRWNRQSQVVGTLKVGPYWLTHYVALEACTEHQVGYVTQYAHEDYHVGVCDLCGRNDAQQPHSFTRAGQMHSATEHVLLCEVCDHVSPEMGAHTFNEKGECTGNLCHATAAVKLTLMNSTDVRYYGDFQSAWDFANQPYSVDTLTLLKDVSITESLTFNREDEVVDESNPEVMGWYYPYIIIKGEGKTISYTGGGSAVTYPDDDDRADPLSLEGGLKLSGNWPAKAAQIGYVIDGNVVVEHDCLASGNASYVTYTLDTNGDEELSTHTFYCDVCHRREHRSHEYDGTADCLCGVKRMIVATVTAESSSEPDYQCGSMEEAWLKAIELSKTSDKEVTIQLLKDVDVTRTGDPQLAYALPISDSSVRIVFNGTDPYGVEHKLYEVEDRYLFHVSQGHLTILSGKFHGPESIVSAAYADCVTLKGGTYPKETRDAISASYYYRYGVLTSTEGGVANMIAPGYILTATANNDLGNLQAGEIVNSNSDEMIACASGVITPCQHVISNLPVTVAKEATCQEGGNIHYAYCNICGAYIDLDHDNALLSKDEAILPALGHTYGEDGLCIRCHTSNAKVTITTYDSEGEPQPVDWSPKVYSKSFPTFKEAWEYYAAGNGLDYLTVITLNEDIVEHPRTIHDDEYDYDYEERLEESSKNDVAINLNGHNLDIKGFRLSLGYGWSESGRTSLKLYDSQKAGKQVSADFYINYNKNDLVLEDVTVATEEFSAQYLTLMGKSGLQFTGEDAPGIGQLEIEPGCYLEGSGISTFGLMPINDVVTGENVVDPNNCIADLMHNVYASANGTEIRCHSTVNVGEYGEAQVILCDVEDNAVTSWHAVKIADVVAHNYSVISDNGSTHGGVCPSCGFMTHEEHNYVSHRCITCGHEAEAYLIADGITTDFTHFYDAWQAAVGIKSTIVINKSFEYENSYSIVNEFTDLTLDLNGKTMTVDYTLYLSNGRLTIEDETGQGTIQTPEYTSTDILYVSNNAALIVTGGNFTAHEYDDLWGGHPKGYGLMVYGDIAASNEDNGARISLQGGTFSSIQISGDQDIKNIFGPDCFLVDASKTDFTPLTDFKKVNSIWDLKEIDNVAVYNPAQKIELTDGIVSGEAEQQLVNNATTNLWVNTFMDTQLATAVDLQDPSIISALQRAAAQQGIVANVNANSEINALIQATLKQVNIEDVTVADNIVKVISRMTFDVKPMAQLTAADGSKIPAQISNDMIQGTVVFRLPVDQNLHGDYLSVYHKADGATDGTLLGNFPIVTKDDMKFVEVTTDSFSEFSYEVANYFELVDGTPYTLTEARVGVDLTYTRKYWDNDWNALYVPFGVEVSEFNAVDCDVYAINMFQQYDTDNDGVYDKLTLEVIKAPANAVTLPNHPYLLRYNGVVDPENGTTVSMELSNVNLEAADCPVYTCSSMSFNYTFQGTYNKMADASSVYSLIVDNETGVTALGKSRSGLRAQRWFMTMIPRDSQFGNTTSAAPSRISIVTDEETGIENILNEGAFVQEYFSTDGNRRAEAQKGINIVRMSDGSTRKVYLH